MEEKEDINHNDFSHKLIKFYDHSMDIKEICFESLKEVYNINQVQHTIAAVLEDKNAPERQLKIAALKINYDFLNFELINHLILSGDYVSKDRFDDKILETIYQTELLLIENEAKIVELLELAYYEKDA